MSQDLRRAFQEAVNARLGEEYGYLGTDFSSDLAGIRQRQGTITGLTEALELFDEAYKTVNNIQDI